MGSTVPIRGQCPSGAYDFRYGGGFGSMVDRLNKIPVTDSFDDTNQLFNVTLRIQGGTHRVLNFRSFHSGGANFSFCDGGVQFQSEAIDMQTYRVLSSMQGNEVASIL